MFTDDDRERIRQEEIFRAEVRASLAQPTPTKTHGVVPVVWDFLNTPVGGWILTSVLAGLIVWTFTTSVESYKAARQERAARDAVRREVEFR